MHEGGIGASGTTVPGTIVLPRSVACVLIEIQMMVIRNATQARLLVLIVFKTRHGVTNLPAACDIHQIKHTFVCPQISNEAAHVPFLTIK